MNHFRKGLKICIPYLVWTLVISIGYALFTSQLDLLLIKEGQVLVLKAEEFYYVKGILLLVPISILGVLVKLLKHLWQFLILSVILVVSVYFLSDCIFFTGIIGALTLIRFKNRVKEEHAMLDRTNYFLVIAFILYFVITGANDLPYLQEMTIYHCFVATLLTFIYYGIERFESYIDIKQLKANVPSQKILNSGTKIFLVFGILVTLLVVPTIRITYDFVEVALPEVTLEEEEEEVEKEVIVDKEIEESEDIYSILDEEYEESPFQALWFFIDDVLILGAYVGCGLFLIVTIYRLIKNFNKTQIYKDDVIESTMVIDSDVEKQERQGSRIREVFDFSKEMKIRRQYKKQLKRYNPENWQTPSEMEQMAKLTIPELHKSYEEARYGKKIYK